MFGSCLGCENINFVESRVDAKLWKFLIFNGLSEVSHSPESHSEISQLIAFRHKSDFVNKEFKSW